ncbi:Hypothetical protein SRAE_0000000300 [Strongyloides ratti]|uniref:Uncharacterized protein n=1 Tax=Strongyloides ratti TaxID=34506 RepID=A0A090KTX6_STRRB|nr:Hypothetical protein SRAE_0000000300 [Strongyloides ratti]CEF60871.1 Hypothetical protein SRAE_0000000300 [Strongyloides ratti]
MLFIFSISIVFLKLSGYKFICQKKYKNFFFERTKCYLAVSITETVFRTIIHPKIYPHHVFKIASTIEKERKRGCPYLTESTKLINKLVSKALMEHFTESLNFMCYCVSKILLFSNSYAVSVYYPENQAQCINGKLIINTRRNSIGGIYRRLPTK